jgi:hypothetical protein
MLNSFFISTVYADVSNASIADTFYKLGLCCIERIESIPHTSKSGTTYFGCFVYVKYWLNTNASKSFQRNILNKRRVKLVYSDPLYWNIRKNTSKVANLPIPKHIDLEFVADKDTSIETIKMVFDDLDLGKIHSVIFEHSMDKINYRCEHLNSFGEERSIMDIPKWIPREKWLANVNFAKTKVTVRFEYWFHTLYAANFQSILFRNSAEEGRFVNVPINDYCVWKVCESGGAPLFENAENPYIWFNRFAPQEKKNSHVIFNYGDNDWSNYYSDQDIKKMVDDLIGEEDTRVLWI